MPVIRELITRWGFQINDKPLSQMDRRVADAKASVGDLGRSVRNLALSLGGAGLSLGGFFKVMGDFEQAEIAFDTLVGDADRAKVALTDLKEFARTTPFNFQQLLESSKKLLAFSFQAEEVVPIMGALGNIAAGVGREKLPNLILAFGQVRAATRLTGMELRQFTEAGVPLLDELGKQFGKTAGEVQDMISQGEVSFDAVQKALFSITGEGGRFYNLMNRQSRSLQGIWSNIVDTAQLMVDKIGKSGLLKEAKNFLDGILTYMETSEKQIIEKVAGSINGLIVLMKGLWQVLKTGATVFNAFARAVGGTEQALKYMAIALAVVIGAQTLSGLGRIVQSVVLLGSAFKVASLSAAAIPLAIGAAIVAMALIAEDIVAFTQGRKSITGLMIKGFRDAFSGSAFYQTFTEIADTIGKLPAMILDKMNALPWRSIIDIPKDILLELPKQLYDAFLELPWSEVFGFPIELINSMLEAIASVTSKPLSLPEVGLFEALGNAFTSTTGIGASPSSSLSPSTVNNASSSNTTLNVESPITINVPPGTDTREIGGVVKEGLRESFDTILRETSRSTRPAVSY